jgi:plastocyanin
MSMSRRRIVFGIGLLGVAAAGRATVAAASAEDQPVRVLIENFAFTPRRVRVPIGATVEWLNRDTEPHTIATSGQKVFKSPALDEGGTFAFAFSQAGTYEYYCTLHPHMTGTIVVE